MPDPRMHIEDGVRFQKIGMLDRALRQFETTVDLATDPATASEALCRQAHIYRSWCRWDDTLRLARRSADVAREARLEQLEAEALNAEAIVLLELGRFDEAVVMFERILGLDIDHRMRGIAYQNLGSIAAQRTDFERAEQYFQSSYKHFSLAGYQWGEAFALTNMAAAAVDSGKHKSAEIIGGQAIRAAKRGGHLELIGIACLNTAEALAAQQDFERAEELASEALGYCPMEENDLRRAQCYRVLGDVRLYAGEKGEARRLYVEAMRLADRVGSDREVARLRDCLELVGEAA